MRVMPARGNLPTTYSINSVSAESKNIGEAEIDTKIFRETFTYEYEN